jgi:hypothetical protein
MELAGGRSKAETLRTFWHGTPLSPYHLFCLHSFVARGHRIELFSYQPDLVVPDWIALRDAAEILPSERILRYQYGPGRGSPALHSNLFRYRMLERLGGWWIDADVLLMRAQLPDDEYFFAPDGDHFSNAIVKFPLGHPLFAEAAVRCEAVAEAATWAQTGPVLFTELIRKFDLSRYGAAKDSCYPVLWNEIEALFDPARCGEMKARCNGAVFVHLYNEIWRRAGIPVGLAPPRGSYLDWLADELGFRFLSADRLQSAQVIRLIKQEREPAPPRPTSNPARALARLFLGRRPMFHLAGAGTSKHLRQPTLVGPLMDDPPPGDRRSTSDAA